MALSENDIELIQKYIGENLTPQDKMLFDSKLENTEFKSELMFQAKSVDALIENDRKDVMAFLTDEKDADEKSSDSLVTDPVNKARKSKFLLGLLIGMLFFFVIVNLNKFMKSHEPKVDQMALVEEANMPYPFLQVGRGEGDDDADLQMLNQNYSKGNYEEALTYFSSRMVEDEQLKLIEANCYIQIKDYKKAIPLLNNLKKSPDSKVSENADWYLSMVHLLDGATEKGKSILKDISNKKNHLFSRQANDLLGALN